MTILRNELETREIDDAELDAVAGGVAGISVTSGLVGAVVSDVTGAVNSLETVNYLQGTVASTTGVGVTGVLGGVAGL
ncbi:hypothetical protein [Streptomyces hoynatensis]|uniref:Type A2 lantipeptide n=1 Tax=Streptomyces hoynatensis TaxID=1141874 RepID=A0A3A9YTT2_9ACTN|nr:hypothetical protein D7294_20975 [Streptomyces hoynatensis]